MPLNLLEFKDLTAGLQSIAIVVATFLGGGWGLYQFFSLRAREKAKLELRKIEQELVRQSVLEVDLVTETFDIDGIYYLHVRVVMQNIGNTFEIVDWAKASMFARRFYKANENEPLAADPMLLAYREPSMEIKEMRLMPGTTTSTSFLIPVPQVGVYYLEFAMHVSQVVRAEMIDALKRNGTKTNTEDFILWRADKFVSVLQAQPNPAFERDAPKAARPSIC
jgi:hypothetical protein